MGVYVSMIMTHDLFSNVLTCFTKKKAICYNFLTKDTVNFEQKHDLVYYGKCPANNFEGCVHYIFASLFLGLNESTCQMKKNVFYFTSKPLFVLQKIKFQNSTFSNFMMSSNA